MCLAASMTDAVLIDLAVRVEPSIEVVFIDTRYHFPETLETVERVRRHYGLNLRVLTVAPQPVELWQADPANCCSAAKVEQLDRALVGKLAWMSGLRRAEAAVPGQGPHRGPRPARVWSRSTPSPPGPTRTWPATSPTTTCRSTRCSPRATRPSAAARAPSRSRRAPIPARAAGPARTRRSAACTSDQPASPTGRQTADEGPDNPDDGPVNQLNSRATLPA